MSRTKNHNNRQAKKELWARRPFSYMPNVKFWRKKCTRKERHDTKMELVKPTFEPSDELIEESRQVSKDADAQARRLLE